MNAALFKQDVQRAKPDAKDTLHQKCIRDLHLHTTDPDKHPYRQYSFWHTTDSSQDSRIDDILVSESMCTSIAAHTEVLNTSGDADHAPVRARIPLTCMKFLKPDSDPPPLPREPRLKTPVSLEYLKAFKEAFDQETGASTANLLQELDSTLELAYAVKETLHQDEALKTALISVGIGADNGPGQMTGLSRRPPSGLPRWRKGPWGSRHEISSANMCILDVALQHRLLFVLHDNSTLMQLLLTPTSCCDELPVVKPMITGRATEFG